MKLFLKYKAYFDIVSLAFLSYLALINTDGILILPRLLILILISLTTEFILTLLFKLNSSFNILNLSFALLVFLITQPTGLFIQIFTVIFAHFAYHLIRFIQKTVFNSVCLAIFVFSFFNLKITWWSININFFTTLTMFALGIFGSYLNKTIKFVAFYLLSTFLFTLILTLNPLFSINQLFIPGLLFFAFYLLMKNITERLTNLNWIIFYSIASSFLALILPKLGFFSDPLVTSVVITDLGIFTLKRFSRVL